MRIEQMQQIPLSQIRCEQQVREQCDENAINGLALSLKAVGQLMPIRVRHEGDAFIVVDGERRLRAAIKAGLATIAAIVEEQALCEGEVVQRQLIVNCQRVDLSAVEKARAIQRLMELTGWKAAEAAIRLGMSAGTVARLTALLSLPGDILARVESGQLAASTAYEIGKIADPVKQAAMAAEAAGGRLTRDVVSGQAKRERKGSVETDTTTASRVVASLGGGRSVTVSGAGVSLDVLIGWLEELLSKARKARTQGLELKTFTKMLRDQAKTNA